MHYLQDSALLFLPQNCKLLQKYTFVCTHQFVLNYAHWDFFFDQFVIYKYIAKS